MDAVPKRKQRVSNRVQAALMQNFAFKAAMALQEANTNKETDCLTMDVKTAITVQKLIAAWGIATEHYRISRNKPLPGSLRPVAKPKHTKSKTEPEPVTPQEAKAEIVPVIEPVPTPAT
jgi:hypothetical protein